MKKYWNRLLAGGMALAMALTLLPVQTLAQEWQTTDAAEQSLLLPVIQEGEEAPEPQGYGETSTFDLAPNEATVSYAYVGDTSISTSDVYILDPTTGERITEKPESNGILQMLDAENNVVASSSAITYYSTNSSGECYVSKYLSNTAEVPAGSYRLQLAAGDFVYPCEGTVLVLGEGDLFLRYTYVESLVPGAAECEVYLTLQGFESEAELEGLSFQLLDGDTVVAQSTKAFRGFSRSGTRWNLHAQLLVVDGQEIEAGKKYSLRIAYTGEKTLVDGVGAVTQTAYNPSATIEDFQVVDAQNAIVSVSLGYLKAGTSYRVTVEEDNSSDAAVYGSETLTAEGETAQVELKLSQGSATPPITDYPAQLYVKVYEGDRTYETTSEQYTNPYKNLNSDSLRFEPRYVKPTATEVAFRIEFSNGCSYWQGAGDVLSLRDSNGTEVGVCKELTLEQAGSSGTITGTLAITGTLQNRGYYLYLNGTQFATVRVMNGTTTSIDCFFVNYSEKTFWMDLGSFPVSLEAFNFAETGHFVLRGGETDVFTSPRVTGVFEGLQDTLTYSYTFTAEDFAGLTGGQSYTLLFQDEKGNEQEFWTDMTYVAEKTDVDWSNSQHGYVRWYTLKAGMRQVEARVYFGNESGPKNVTEEDLLASVRKLYLSDGTKEYHVTGYTGGTWKNYSYTMFLTLDEAVPAGTYTVYQGETQIESDISVSAASSSSTTPTVWGSNAVNCYVSGQNLPAGSSYTGRIYDRYNSVTGEFPMWLREKADSSTQYLHFSKAVLADLKPGTYELRVYMDKELLDCTELTIAAETTPIITLNDEDDDWSDKIDPVMHVPEVRISVTNIGAYSYLRWAETEEALAKESFKVYYSNYYYSHTFTGEDGPRTLYVELSKTGKADDGENLVYPFSLWLCTSKDYGLQVPEEIQGVRSESNYTISATTTIPAADLWVSFYDADGKHASRQMEYVGPTENGRYAFKLSFPLNGYYDHYFYDQYYGGEDAEYEDKLFYYKNTQSIRVFATDLSTEYHENETWDGNLACQPVERILIFGDPSAVILPQFSGGSVLTNQVPYTVYGYATPNGTVTLIDGDAEPVTAETNDYGYFSFTLTDLTDGAHELTVADANESVASRTVTLNVDRTPPVISGMAFTFLENGAAVLRWTCDDEDVDYFLIYKNSELLGRAQGTTRSYNVTASQDDGNSFTVVAYDLAGNRSDRKISTKDEVPPDAPEKLEQTGATDSTVTLLWAPGTDNMGVAGYNIYRDGVELTRLTGEATTYTVTGLEQGKSYVFSVKTRDNAGNLSETAATVTASTLALTLTPTLENPLMVDKYHDGKKAPVSFTVTAPEGSKFTPTIQSAKMYYQKADSADKIDADAWKEISLTASENTASGSWDISGEINGYLPMGDYQVYFKAEYAEGLYLKSAYQTVTLKRDDVAPEAPTNVQGTKNTTTTITLTWDAATDNVGVTEYEIYRNNEQGVAEKVGTCETNQYTDTGLTSGQTYTYTIKAKDAAGNLSKASEAVELKTLKLEFASVMEFAKSYVMEEQKDAAIPVLAVFKPIEGYEPQIMVHLQYQRLDENNTGEGWRSVELSAGEDNTFTGSWSMKTDDGEYLPKGTYQVRFSVTDGYATEYSETQTVELKWDETPPEVTKPKTEIAGKGSATRFGGTTKLTVDTYATDEIGVTKMELSYAKAGSDQYTVLKTQEGEAAKTSWLHFEWDPKGLSSGTYILKATAYDARENKSEATVTVTVDNDPPTTPGNFKVTGTSRYIHLMWDQLNETDRADFQTFRVYRSESGAGEFTKVKELNSIGYFDDGKSIKAGKTYDYYVTAVDTLGNESAPTATLSATYVKDTESPVIGGIWPHDGAALIKNPLLRVRATDNYRLAKAEFYYMRDGDEGWTLIGSVDAKVDKDNTLNNQTFNLTWTDMPEVTEETTCKIKALVYDASINETKGEDGTTYAHNPPAEKITTVTLKPYNGPVAPELTGTAGYLTATLKWTYGGDTDLLRDFIVYKVDEYGNRTYVTSTPENRFSCTVTLPAEGETTFVVVATDVFGTKVDSNTVTLTSDGTDKEAPEAVIQPETLRAAAGVPFAFSGAGSTDNVGIVSYTWDFGDKTSEETKEKSVTHTYAEAGEYTVKLTVTDEAGNTNTATATMTVYDISKDSEYALLTVTAVNAYKEGTPAIEGAEIRIYDVEGGNDLGGAVTAEDGTATFVVPVGQRNITATAEGFLAVSRSVNIQRDKEGNASYQLSMTPMKASLVDGSLSVTEMTYDEIVGAGIDPNDPANQHTFKFAAKLGFVAAPSLPFDPISLTGYFNSAGDFLGGEGWGWNVRVAGGGSGDGETSNKMNIGVFPISERCVLVIYGEAHWLKEMYNVELLVINNSYADDITSGEATLTLPEGMSLVGGGGLTQGIPRIPAKTADDNGSNTARVNWYVRGDKAGDYNLTATVTGKNPDPFAVSFTTDRPVHVYAGNALKLYITADDIAYRGGEYHVQFTLRNETEKSIYNLSFGLTGAEEFKALTIGDKEIKLPLSEESFTNGKCRQIPELKPGGSVTVDFYTKTWFNSVLELVDMGPFDVGYYLTSVFLTTLEGSTTTIPYEVTYKHLSHGTFLEWVVDQVKDGAVDKVMDYVGEKIPLLGTAQKVYKFYGEATDRAGYHDPASSIVITVDEKGSFRTNEVRPQALTNSASVVEVYTDADPADYTISADGKTMTITGDATIYVKGNEAGESTVTFTTYAQVPNSETEKYETKAVVSKISYLVDGQAAGDPARIVLNQPAETPVAVPLEGKTASVTFPCAVLDADNNYLAADGLTWSVTDEDGKDAEGVSMMNGVLTVWPDAKAGTYTVTAALGTLKASQTIKLTKEEPTATRIRILRSGDELTADTLMIPVSDVSVSTYYTAQLLDQYGEVIQNLPLTASDLPEDVTFAYDTETANGKLTLTKASQPGTVTLTAKDEESNLSATVTITITNLAVDWNDVENTIKNTTYTYGDINGKATLPASGTAQAADTTVNGTFAYEEPNTIQNAGNGTITVTFTVTDEGAYHDVTLTETFPITIAKKALADSMITITGSYTYTGSAITPTYAVADGTLMVEDDYDVTVSNNTNAGTATVTVTAAENGNYTSSASKTFTIAKAAITGFAAAAPSHTLLANAEANSSLAALKTAADLPETVEVTFGEGGTATLPITWADSQETFSPKGGTYHYVGTVTAGENFQPCEKTLTATVTVKPVTGTVAWTTTAITLAKAQVDAAKSLSDLGLPASLTVTYDNGVGEATYTLMDANYTVTLAYLQSLSVAQGDRTVEIAVTGEPFPAWATIETSALRAALTITEKFPVTVTVTPPAGITYGETLGAPSAAQTALSHGTDENATYRYQYKLVDAPDTAWTETAPTQAGRYLVRATLVSDTHSGSGTAEFTIGKKALTAGMITVTGDYTYTGSAIEPTYTVADGALMTAADYTVTVSNNINAGAGTITVTAAEGGNYTSSASQTFPIQARSLTDSGVTVAPLAEETYRGSALTPIPAVSFDGRRLALGTDFTVTYRNNTNAGTATATIQGLGNFTDSREVTFTIRPAALSGTLTLQGDAAVGSTLTAVLSVESAGTYQWYRDGEAIQDATGNSYTITADDVNAVLTVRFTASGNYTGTLESAAVKVGKQLLTGTVTLSADTAEVGTELTLIGTVNGDAITAESEHYQIQWLRDGAAIPGANGLTYTAAPADRGHTLTAVLTATGETYTGSLTSGGVSVNTEAPILRLTATAGNGQVTLNWTAENGGGHITHFLLTGPDGILTLAAEENSYTYTGLTNGTAYTFRLTVQTAEGKSAADSVIATPKAASGGISGGGSGGQEEPGTTVTNPDGSVTTTVVDEATGSVTETTRYPDGGVTTVTTGTDGTVETEIRRADGVKVTAKETADGSLDFQAELPKSVSSARVKVPASLGKDPGQVTVTLTDASGKTWTETVRYRNGSLILTLDASVTGVLRADFQPVQRFRDVPFGSYCTDAVDWAAELGITTGTTPETFSPAASCTRAQMTVFLWRAMGCPDADGTLLPDVDANAYYAKAILWAQTMGITKGTANGTFDPNGTVNRAQMVTFLWRLAGEPAGKGTLPFTDVDADAYYAEAVRWAVAQGITKGTTASTFAPNEPCNRGQIVTFLYRYLEH